MTDQPEIYDDPEAAIVRVVKCECGKVHTAAGISANTECACGRKLWARMWRDGR